MTRSVIWIDDDIDKRQSYASALRNACDIELDCVSDPQKGLELLHSKHYDSAIIDLHMNDINGCQIIDHCIDNNLKCSFAILSSFLYMESYRDRLNRFNINIKLIDKDFPAITSPEFETLFITPLKEFIEEGATSTVSSQLKLTVPDNTDPFNVTYDEYIKMSMAEKDALTELAREKAETTINDAFKDGDTWVFLCGSPQKIRFRASEARNRLPPVEMLDLAKEKNRAPFHFFAPSDVDDLPTNQKWADCGKNEWIQNYPSLTIEFNDHPLRIHFDTGAHVTFMSYEQLLATGAIEEHQLIWSSMKLKGQTTKVAQLSLEVTLRCPKSDSTIVIYLFGQIVRDWNNGPLVRRCEGQSCEQLSPLVHNGENCKLRVGLIGRNVLTDNELSLVLDGAEKVVRFPN